MRRVKYKPGQTNPSQEEVVLQNSWLSLFNRSMSQKARKQSLRTCPRRKETGRQEEQMQICRSELRF
jgi:hypothetical protein